MNDFVKKMIRFPKHYVSLQSIVIINTKTMRGLLFSTAILFTCCLPGSKIFAQTQRMDTTVYQLNDVVVTQLMNTGS